MAITTSAKKAIRVAARRRVMNLRRMDTMRESVKAFRAAVAGGRVAEAEKALSGVYQAIDKAAKRGVIKKGTAARRKSRIVALMRKAGAKKK